jgi:hypothetical protein
MQGTHARLWRWTMLVALVGLTALGGCKTTPPEEEENGEEGRAPSPAGPHADVVNLLPAAADVTNWKPESPLMLYSLQGDPETGVEPLEADLGTAASAYRQYDYVASAKRTYVRGQAGETVTLRIVRMETPSEAFGIFSVQAEGDDFPIIGLAARMGTRSLGFVKGAYYVSLTYSGPSAASGTLMEFGRWVADQITSPGYKPALLQTFPIGSVQGERDFLHTFETLASLDFVPKGDPTTMARRLALGSETEVAIVGYPTTREGVLNHLFVIRYPTSVDASAAYTAYKAYLEDSTNPAEQNVAVAPPVGAYLAGTFNAEENSINDRLADLLDELGG